MTKERKIREHVITLPEGVSISHENRVITVKGKSGECVKTHKELKLVVKAEGSEVRVGTTGKGKRDKMMLGTLASHIKNMIKGVSEGHEYKVKICSGHFPMKVTFGNNELTVKNFLGEKIPRIAKVAQGVNVQVDGDIIVIKSHDKELAGQAAANMEQLTRVTNRDRRIFQDGLFIISKAGKYNERIISTTESEKKEKAYF